MYGYVRPDRGELRVRDYERFRAMYCGLCETLRERYGLPARFIVNYDLTFMAMALTRDARLEPRRCPVHPAVKRPCVFGSPALDAAADYSVILAWWKLQDSASDEAAARAALSRTGSAAMHRAYGKAASLRAAFDANAGKCLEELSRLERARCPSLDQAADCFARILAFAAEETEDPEDRRVQRELFYHVGRSVYILDAVDDLDEDIRKKNYNPLRFRFLLKGGVMDEEQRSEIRSSLNLSQRSAAAALALRREDEWQPILDNIVTLGLPKVTELVFSGKWDRKKKDDRSPASLWNGDKRT